jgi:hypothetical protein
LFSEDKKVLEEGNNAAGSLPAAFLPTSSCNKQRLNIDIQAAAGVAQPGQNR